MRRIGVLGCGAMGSLISRAIDEGTIAKAKLTALYDVISEKCLKLSRELGRVKPRVCRSFEEFLDAGVDLVVETASQEAVRNYAPEVVSKGVDLMILSVGALLDPELEGKLEDLARRTGAKIYVPSGAIAGVDGIAAASILGVERIRHVIRKAPSSFGEEVLRRFGIPPGLKEPRVIYRGKAEEAVKLFPANVNVVATLRLCSRAPVEVEVVVDPEVSGNVHEITVESRASRIHVKMENLRHPENPRTSLIAALSAVRMLKRICDAGLIIGT